MKKGIIIIGSQGAGKTSEAKKITQRVFDEGEIVWLHGSDYKRTIHHYCKPNTNVIIIEEIEYMKECVSFFGDISQRIKISPFGTESFEINPKLILVKQVSYPNARTEAYYKNRFPLYHIHNMNNLDRPKISDYNF